MVGEGEGGLREWCFNLHQENAYCINTAKVGRRRRRGRKRVDAEMRREKRGSEKERGGEQESFNINEGLITRSSDQENKEGEKE